VNWSYTAIMMVAVATGAVLFYRLRQPSGLRGWEIGSLALGAFCGGMIGAKLPFVLASWHGFLGGAAWFDDGKTIMAGLMGGYFGVQIVEWQLKIQVRGDDFAVPLAAAVSVGRLACFVGGCCYGTVTSLPWGVDFGDGQPRHPSQLYESAFHLCAALVLYQFQRRGILQGRLIRVYFIAYCLYRFCTEFIRPEPGLWLGLTGYQWAALLLAVLFAVWRCPSCSPRRAARPQGGILETPLDASQGQRLKDTWALCPHCLRSVAGRVFLRGGGVYLERECPQHGRQVALLSSDRRRYYLRDEVCHPPPASGSCCCSGSPGHKTCVGLLELTGACNLECPVCYAAGSNGRHRRFEDLCADLEAFVSDRGSLEVLQLSGGEPLLHPDLFRLLDVCKTLPIDHVMINTNGLELLHREDLAAQLAARKPHLELYLQLDGLDAESHKSLRGADLLAQKQRVIEKVVANDLPTTLVCTLVKGVNESQVGPLVSLAIGTPQLRGITFQPATWAGRFDCRTDPMSRITLADVVDLIVQQSGGIFEADDFKPLPCGNPNCCSFTYALRRPNGNILPLPRVVRIEDHLVQLSDRMNFNLRDAQQYGQGGARPEDFFRIVIKPFMDAYTYDQDRVDECCVHVIRPGGKAVSFCRFNVLERGRGDGKPPLSGKRTHDFNAIPA
jgi:uncharacterized radical SAM superfamily Fe-S cluster-containing enzyme/prolipoprotein diacylglyceryltransferase